jgi:hypothetical protein
MRTYDPIMTDFLFPLLTWFITVCVIITFLYILEICNAVDIAYFVAAFPCAYLTRYILAFRLEKPPQKVSDDNDNDNEEEK